MRMKRNRMKLRQLMAKHELKCTDVGVLLNRKHRTVRDWCSVSGNDIPDEQLDNLHKILRKGEG